MLYAALFFATSLGVLTPLADMRVRDFLAVANTALVGGATPYTISDLDATARQLNGSFLAGPSTWAQERLFAGACP